MEILIVEDQNYQAELLAQMLARLDSNYHIAGIADTIVKATEILQTKKTIDLIFMDVHLNDEVCFKLFSSISIDIPVIYTTSFSSYCLEAFHHNGIHYLVKPITPNRLKEGLEKYAQLRHNFLSLSIKENYENILFFRCGKKSIALKISEIAYIQSKSTYAIACNFDNRKTILNYNLDKLSRQLESNGFLRLNRQYLVSAKAIKQFSFFDKGRIKVMIDPLPVCENVLVSFKNRHRFLNWLENKTVA